MNLIAIVLSLAVERFLNQVENMRRYSWIKNYYQWIAGKLPEGYTNGILGTISLILPPVIMVALVFYILDVVLGFLLSILVLLYCLGPRLLDVEVENYISALNQQDTQRISETQARFYTFDQGESSNAPQFSVAETLFFEANQRMFAVIFWFIVLGPAGALLYRLCIELKNEAQYYSNKAEFYGYVTTYVDLLNFLPANLTALSYALCGSFKHAFDNWRGAFRSNANLEALNAQILIYTGKGAALLHHHNQPVSQDIDSLQTSLELIWRTTILWIFVIAIFTLANWID